MFKQFSFYFLDASNWEFESDFWHRYWYSSDKLNSRVKSMKTPIRIKHLYIFSLADDKVIIAQDEVDLW